MIQMGVMSWAIGGKKKQKLKDDWSTKNRLGFRQLDAFVGTPATKHGFGPAASLFHWEASSSSPVEQEAVSAD